MNKFKLTLEQHVDKISFVVFQFNEKMNAINFLLDPTELPTKKITFSKNEDIEISCKVSEFIYDSIGNCVSINLCNIIKTTKIGLQKFVSVFVCWIPSTQLLLIEQSANDYTLSKMSPSDDQIDCELLFKIELV